MLTKAEIFELVKSKKKPQGFSRDAGRNAYHQACKKVLDKGMEKYNSANPTGPSGPKGPGE